MLESKIEKQKKKIEDEKKKIQIKEKLLRELEKKSRTKNFANIGRIAFKADIDILDKNVLLGAFLEIADRTQNNKDVESWKTRANKFFKSENFKNKIALSVTFSSAPSEEAKVVLKENGFKWNRIRNEFCGYGIKSSLEMKLTSFHASIKEL